MSQVIEPDVWQSGPFQDGFEVLVDETVDVHWSSELRNKDQAHRFWPFFGINNWMGRLEFPQLFQSRRTQFCSLISLRLLARFVSPYSHWPVGPLRSVLFTLIVPRSQSMSCHLRQMHSLGRIPVVIATANRAPYIVGNANFKNVFDSSTLSTLISRLRIRGSFSPLVGTSKIISQRKACLNAAFRTQ